MMLIGIPASGRARANGVPYFASCPPADKSDRASASSFTYAKQGTPFARAGTMVDVPGQRPHVALGGYNLRPSHSEPVR
jgi:hypothetical protein